MLLAEQAGGGVPCLDGCPATLGHVGHLNPRFMAAALELSERPEILGKMCGPIPGEMGLQNHRILTCQGPLGLTWLVSRLHAASSPRNSREPLWRSCS